MNRTNYIFVDFENVHEVDLDLIAGKTVVVTLVLGERNKSLPVEMVEALLHRPAEVRMVRCRVAGKNSLDFVLAYHVGRQVLSDPGGYFHILSRDKGFDALILHLKDNGVFAARHEEFVKIPVLQKEPPGLDERIKVLKTHFAENKTNRPAKEKTLRSFVFGRFAKTLSDAELSATIAALAASKVVELTKAGAVRYTV